MSMPPDLLTDPDIASDLSAVIERFERDFTVHDERGFKEEDGRLDLDRAPDGTRYVTVTSSGMRGLDRPVPGWFHASRPTQAMDAWLDEARIYAREKGKHLWWRERPAFRVVDFVAVAQHLLIAQRDLRDTLAVSLVFVTARLLVTEKG